MEEKQEGASETKRSKMVWKNRKMEPEGSNTEPKNTKMDNYYCTEVKNPFG